MWVPLAVGAAFATLVAALSLTLHPLPVHGGEDDHYLRGLRALLAGRSAYDQFHPVHTVLFGAVLHWLLGLEPFTALRVVSAISGGVIVATTLVITRRFASPTASWVAAAVVALHPGVLLHGMQASSDALATALALLTLATGLRAAASARLVDLFLAGLCFGLALGTRFTIVGFGFALVLAWRRQHFVHRVLATGLGTALGFAPHGIVAWRTFGSPFANENWRSVVLKHGGFDQRLMDQPGFDGPLAFWRAHGGEVLDLGIADVSRQLRGELGSLVVGSGGGAGNALATTLGAMTFVAVVGLAVRRTRSGLMVAACFVAQWLLVCMTFAQLERVMLPLVAIAAVAMAAATAQFAIWWRCLFAAGLAAIGVAAAAAIPSRFAAFCDLHPQTEIAAAHELLAHPEVEFATASWTHMAEHAPVIGYLPDFVPCTSGDADAVTRLRAEMARTKANAFVIGRRTAPHFHRLARTTTFPPDCIVLRTDDDVVAVVIQARFADGGAAGHWFAGAEATPNPWSDGPITLRAVLRADADPAAVAQIAVRLEPPPRTGPLLPLQPAGDCEWQARWTVRPPPGSWHLQFRAQLCDGRYVLGPRVAITVR
jgi:hypothetical protein